MKSYKSTSSVIAFAAAAAVFSPLASADSGTRGLWGSHVPAWPMSVSESAPWKAADEVRPTDHAAHAAHAAVGATGQVHGGSEPSRAVKRQTPFPSSVSESAPWRLDQ